jgi:hypothetical protein
MSATPKIEIEPQGFIGRYRRVVNDHEVGCFGAREEAQEAAQIYLPPPRRESGWW